MKQKFKEVFLDGVRQYLKDNNLKHTDLTSSAQWGDLAQRAWDWYDRELRRESDAQSEAEWIAGLEERFKSTGISIRDQLVIAKEWYAQHDEPFYRRRFLKWLKNVDIPLRLTDPSAPPPVRRIKVWEQPDWDWRRQVAELYPRADYPDRQPYEEMPWLEVNMNVRQTLIERHYERP